MDLKVDWALLPKELVHSISQRLDKIVDYVRFRAVCKPWNSTIDPKPRHLPLQSPWLMLPSDENDTGDYTFICLATNNSYKITLPQALGKRCCGSSHGWLILLDADKRVTLLNPLTQEQLSLPSTFVFPTVFDLCVEMQIENLELVPFALRVSYPFNDVVMQKIVLSGNPNNQGTVAVAIISRRIAYCRPQTDNRWRIIDSWRGSYTDCTYHNGKFYVIDPVGTLLIVEFAAPMPTVELVVPPPEDPQPLLHRYVMEVDGKVHMVCRVQHWCNFLQPRPGLVVMGFLVFRLELGGEEPRWMAVRDIGGKALFIGVNHSYSFSAEAGLDENCIYFADDFCWQLKGYVHDEDLPARNLLGVFNMVQNQVNPLPYNVDCSQFIYPPPKWVTPSLE